MRWRKRHSRVVKRFALLPIEARLKSDSYVYEHRWLETVYLYQSFGDMIGWVTCYFVTKKEYDEYKLQIKKEQKDDIT